VLSCGTATIKGTTSFDLETGKPAAPSVADVWWQQIDATTRYLVPQNGAALYNVGVTNLESITLADLQTAPYSAVRIRGTRTAPSGTIGVDSVVDVRTRHGDYAKLQINTYGWDIVVTWVTYPNG
jgi:hypothetical protein